MYGDMPRNGGADIGVSCPTPDPPNPGATICLLYTSPSPRD